MAKQNWSRVFSEQRGSTRRKNALNGKATRQRRLWKTRPHVCHWCRCDLFRGAWTMDHLQPLCAGGTNADENVVLSCFDCNQKKSGRMPDDFRKAVGNRVIRRFGS